MVDGKSNDLLIEAGGHFFRIKITRVWNYRVISVASLSLNPPPDPVIKFEMASGK